MITNVMHKASMDTDKVRATPVKAREQEEAGLPVQDTVEKGTEKSGFFTDMKKLVSSGIESKEEAYRSSDLDITEKYKTELMGAGAGALVFGTIGAGFAYSQAMAEVNKLPVESVSLNWKEPIMQSKTLGQIPADYYQPNSVWGMFNNNNGNVDVVRDAPALDASGQPYLQPRSHTFTDHGKPVVRWSEQTIRDPQLKGWSESSYEDTEEVLVGHHHESVKVGYDNDNNPIYEDRQVDDYETRMKGWQHRFTPDIKYNNLGTWEKPEVTFETGVNVGLRTLGGFALGATTGAVACALAARAAKKAIENMQQKQAEAAAK
ncbi:MAG: hypothetical protein AB9903_07500 [Vulcanimicrobiota bacterium]